MLNMLGYAFMQRAFLAGTLVGLFCPLVGVFVVLRRHAMVGDAFAHAALTGIALGIFFHWQPLYSALGIAVLAAVGVEFLRRHYRGYQEMAMALTLSASIALAGVLFSLGQPMGGDLHSYLFGSIVAIGNADLLLIGLLGIIVWLVLGHYWHQLFYIIFDEEAAQVAGVPVERVNMVFALLTAVTITLSMRIVGVLLVSSLLVVPVAVALQVGRSFRQTVVISIGTALLSIYAGLSMSFFVDVSPGGVIILCGLGFLVAVVLGKQFLATAPRLLSRFRSIHQDGSSIK